jgi:glycosyltransferase involved in cell wall biosynthesis
VKFMPFVPEEELIRHYRCARFFVVPLKKTTHSGAGTNSVLEAGAFYKAVIATRTGGMETFIRDGKTGILVEPHDVKAMRAAIKKLWSQPDLSHQMGFNNRSYVEATFNPAVINSSIRQFIDTVFVESVSN